MKYFFSYIIKFTLLTGVLLGLGGCFSLEEEVDSILTTDRLNNEADILAALAPIYRTYAKVLDYPQQQQIVAFGADDITTYWGGNKAPLRVFDSFDYGNGENAGSTWLATSWDGYWLCIYYANTLISNLEVSSAPADIVQIAEGEARFMRALCYFNLVRAFGNIPIILHGDVPTGEEMRATVLDNYKVIENDLVIAENSLPIPAAVSEPGRASSAAAKALLADLYMTWAGWPVKDIEKYQRAAAKAKEVIDMNYFELLPINKLWERESQNSLESIFSIQFSRIESIRSHYPTSFSFYESRGLSDIYPELQFFLDFPKGPRKDVTFGIDIPYRTIKDGAIIDRTPATRPWESSQMRHPMYKKFTISEDLNVNTRTAGYRAVEIIRYAEVLLIYAEAEARSGGGSGREFGLEAYNQIKRRAAGLDYMTPVPLLDATSVTAEEIVQEKAWELAGEFKRWWDLVRLEKVGEVMAQRDITEQVALKLDATGISWKQYIAPIPTKALSGSKLVQNPEGFLVQ